MTRLFFIIILTVTGITDAATKKIHNIFPLLIIVLALIRMLHDPASIPVRVIGFFALSTPMLLLTLLHGGLGGGDIKLSAACGLFLGVDTLLIGFFLAALLALIIRLVLHLSKKQDLQGAFALGPYLSVGFILASFL